MIRITVEIVPLGLESLKEQIGFIEIINDGHHPECPDKGSYTAKFFFHPKETGGKIMRKTVHIKEHIRDSGIIPLIELACKECNIANAISKNKEQT